MTSHLLEHATICLGDSAIYKNVNDLIRLWNYARHDACTIASIHYMERTLAILRSICIL